MEIDRRVKLAAHKYNFSLQPMPVGVQNFFFLMGDNDNNTGIVIALIMDCGPNTAPDPGLRARHAGHLRVLLRPS